MPALSVLRPKRRNVVSDPMYAPPPQPAEAVHDGSPMPMLLRMAMVACAVSFMLALLPGRIGSLFSQAGWVLAFTALLLGIPYLYHLARNGLLWRLRNKLILTYLLIGFTPIALFFTLVFLSGYVSAGQFAIRLASTHLQAQIGRLQVQNRASALHIAEQLENGVPPDRVTVPERLSTELDDRRQTALYLDRTPLAVAGISGHNRSPLHIEPWMSDASPELRAPAFDGGTFYLVAVDRVPAGSGHTLTMITSVPLDARRMARVAEGLGRVTLLTVLRPSLNGEVRHAQIPLVAGGTLPGKANLLDIGVDFGSRLPAVEWQTGGTHEVMMQVQSRPSLLYQQLFGEGMTSGITDPVRVAFVAVAFFFALLEVLAFYVAMRLSRSVTQSVENLYAATLSIDRGDFGYRIPATRNDQLADLGRSFNRMTWSLARLIDEQKEKERMQSELSIAQEVQANLFPLSSVPVPNLEVHGVCRPARTVSGDYYDFLVFHDDRLNPKTVTGLGLALGDISGKGISAALLMATLHSAVRAYRFASEQMLSPASIARRGAESIECGELFESPARILDLLNRHLFLSTQPEKYATLFLAHYDQASARLTYSTAGQLPPLVLCADGSVKRLDRGGTVVGLIPNAEYQEETVQLLPGDILIAYSDGVTEPENDFGDFGEERLLEVVREFRNEPLQVISDEVMRALFDWIGSPEQPDDITLVLARQL